MERWSDYFFLSLKGREKVNTREKEDYEGKRKFWK
jgi:hypothetical protein